jgi:hypothetical protein
MKSPVPANIEWKESARMPMNLKMKKKKRKL